jgi:hypothetical protein
MTMSLPRVGFCVFSVCLHVAALPLLWQHTSFMRGAASAGTGLDRAPAVLRVAMVSNDMTRQPIAPTMTHRKDAAKEPQPIPVLAAAYSFAGAAPSIQAAADPVFEQGPVAAIPDGYSPQGRLTRLPAPVADIDLDVPELSNSGIAGTIDMTLFINANGTVANVLASVTEDQMHAFAQLVAERFKNSRFLPGEIDGKAVNSMLKITVVSENSAGDMK